MQKGLLFFLLFITTLSKAQDIDVLHYNFIVSLDDKSDTIIGIAYISFVLKADVSTVSFDLTNTKPDGKGMRVSAVTEATKEAKSLSFSHENDKLTIQLRKGIKEDTCEVMISYLGTPSDGLIISKNKFGERTFFGDNWPNRAHNWLPCVDQPTDKASCVFVVSAPSQYKVVANGIKTAEVNHGLQTITTWQEDVPLPTKVMVIGVARFATKIFDDSPENIPISAWVYPQDSTKGFYDYALATEIVKFFSGYIAPFPYNKLANVQSTTIFGGMENASCIFYDEKTVTGDRSSEDLLAHEIAHQWFGDMASEKSFAHLWLSEGFASYMTDLYFEKKYGREAFVERLQKEREDIIDFAQSSKRPVVDSTTNLMSLLNANSYQKGAWVLHMLRTEVGDSAFHQIIRTYYSQYKGGNAETRDFEAVAEKVSGKDFKEFFDQWLYEAGIPVLSIKSYAEKDLLMFTINQLQEKTKTFPLEIEVVDVEGNHHRFTEKIAARKNIFKYSFGKRIKTINIDPDTKLLFEEADKK
jgi:aminopeptidase N